MRRWSFTKGHGTENDFVLVLDRESTLALTPGTVRYLCDRRAGIGGDGLLRVVLAKHVAGWDGDGSLWFMDYRNADGSLAQMCGNGLRVFTRFLLDEGLASGPEIAVATRSGLRRTTALPDGRVRAGMGPVRVEGSTVAVTTADGRGFAAAAVEVGNPHAVALLDASGPEGFAELSGLDLGRGPVWAPADRFPDGVNCEFVVRLGPRHLAMRVHERGVGETRSCGTGTVAAAAAARAAESAPSDLPVVYVVDVPGGRVEVELTTDEAFLTGPAVLVAHGEVSVPDEGPAEETEEI